MKITRKSQLTGIERTLDINISQELYDRWLLKQENIQDVMPHISRSEREFILTGITDEEWNFVFNEEDDNDIDNRPF
jgi:7,8-dihydro-6-hydroxymethylpterin-pyrophosphokinase